MSTTALKKSALPEASPLSALASLHKALADQLRLQILRLLMHESFGVLELCRILDIRQSALSHHLKILARAELVSTRREGNSIFYRRAFLSDEDPYRSLKAEVFQQID
ncbi:MAG: metalloregulator ArsR/SmtB family transcription factor, partial [Pseudomonadales bacterium]|nr:metalloregulator ArsR/SmtB family transcription factor [Pseudomonadales bacterium]